MKKSRMLYWTTLKSKAEAQEIVRMLEDAQYVSYDNAVESSHNSLMCRRCTAVSVWDDNHYVAIHKNGIVNDTHEDVKSMGFKEFKAMLQYKASE